MSPRHVPALGEPFVVEARRFVRYRVDPYLAGVNRLESARRLAIISAQAKARKADLRPIDVAQAVEQYDGTWLVELEVRS